MTIACAGQQRCGVGEFVSTAAEVWRELTRDGAEQEVFSLCTSVKAFGVKKKKREMSESPDGDGSGETCASCACVCARTANEKTPGVDIRKKERKKRME